MKENGMNKITLYKTSDKLNTGTTYILQTQIILQQHQLKLFDYVNKIFESDPTLPSKE